MNDNRTDPEKKVDELRTKYAEYNCNNTQRPIRVSMGAQDILLIKHSDEYDMEHGTILGLILEEGRHTGMRLS